MHMFTDSQILALRQSKLKKIELVIISDFAMPRLQMFVMLQFSYKVFLGYFS